MSADPNEICAACALPWGVHLTVNGVGVCPADIRGEPVDVSEIEGDVAEQQFGEIEKDAPASVFAAYEPLPKKAAKRIADDYPDLVDNLKQRGVLP